MVTMNVMCINNYYTYQILYNKIGIEIVMEKYCNSHRIFVYIYNFIFYYQYKKWNCHKVC